MPELAAKPVGSSEILIKPVTTRRDQKLFLDFPWKLYRGDPHWIPPLRRNQRELAGFLRHPFYKNAEGQAFLAMRRGEVCGRVEAIIDHAHNRMHSEQLGSFGFFECIDDQQVADALFDAVKAWCRDRGVHSIRGPVNPSMNYECGLLVEGFDSSPTFMMTYNPPYYARLIEEYGFRKVHDLLAFWGHINMLAAINDKIANIARQARERFNVTVPPMDRTRFKSEVRMFLEIFNRSFIGSWGFVPMSESELLHTSASLRRLIVPELVVVAEAEGKTIGAIFALPDFNPRVKQIDGRLTPWGIWRLLRNKREIKKIRLISTNVVPEFQRWGIGLVLLKALLPQALDWGVQEAEFSWVLESNHLSRGSLEKGGAKLVKTYRLYDYNPDEP